MRRRRRAQLPRRRRTGSYPNMGPLLLVQAGVAPRRHARRRAVRGAQRRRPRSRCAAATCPPRRGRRHGRGPGARRACARANERAPARDRRGARGVRAQHGRAHARGARAARRASIELPALRHRLPRPPGAGRRARGRPPARPARRCGPTSATCKPVLVGVDGGADALLEEGFTPDMIVGDMDSAAGGDAALRRRARRPRLPRRPRARPRARSSRSGCRTRSCPAPGHEPGRRDADRRREGRAS